MYTSSVVYGNTLRWIAVLEVTDLDKACALLVSLLIKRQFFHTVHTEYGWFLEVVMVICLAL